MLRSPGMNICRIETRYISSVKASAVCLISTPTEWVHSSCRNLLNGRLVTDSRRQQKQMGDTKLQKRQLHKRPIFLNTISNDQTVIFYSRFAELAFNRGKLAQAVLRGSGEMMLFTCLKRSLGESLPNEQKQRRLFESSSVHKRVNSGSSVVFNRGEVNSAVGLTVNVLMDARRNVELLTKLANGDGALPDNGGAETLRKVYPFLSDRDEQAQLAEYDRLLHGSDADEAGLIKSARLKTEAIIARKAQMKHQFCDTLRKMSQNASLAAAMFSSDDFITSLNSALTQNKASVHEIEREQPSCDNVVPEVGSAPEGSDLPPTEPQNDGDANG